MTVRRPKKTALEVGDRIVRVVRNKAVGGSVPAPVRLTPRQHDLLYHQCSDDHWCTPMMLGGTDGSHHSTTLAQLVRKKLVERSSRGGHTRNAWQYRRTPAGKKAVCREDMAGTILKVTDVAFGSGGTRARIRVRWDNGHEASVEDRQLLLAGRGEAA